MKLSVSTGAVGAASARATRRVLVEVQSCRNERNLSHAEKFPCDPFNTCLQANNRDVSNAATR